MNPLVVIIIIMTAVCVGLIAIIKAQVKRADNIQEKAESLRKALWGVEWKAERLQTALDRKTKVEVQAHEERKALSDTADADLVHRANNLFM